MAATLTENDEGADWLYWDPKPRRWRRVELLVVPSPSPRRVRVQHLDRDLRGAAEWVPASRCKVPWRDRDEYLARTNRWHLVREGRPPESISDTAALLLARYADEAIAEFDTAGGVLLVRDAERLCRLCGIPEREMTAHPTAFCEDRVWVLPWPAAESVVQGLCRIDPSPALRLLDEHVGRHQAFDRLVELEGPRWWQCSLDVDDPNRRRAELLQRSHSAGLAATQRIREWLDHETAPGVAQAYVELRGMYADLADAARVAIPRLAKDRTRLSRDVVDHLEELLARPTPAVDVRGVRMGGSD